MTRKITYKAISKDLENMVKPTTHSTTRPSLGLEGAVGEFFYLLIDELVPYRNQARKLFNQEEIVSLSESILLYGVRQPLTVLPISNGKYEVVSGERRLRAAKLAQLEKVPCIILKNDSQADAVALIENIHRKDLHPIELGVTYKKLIENNVFLNQADLAQKISVSKSHVSECIKYTLLEEEVQDFILQNKINSRDKLRKVLKAHEKNDQNEVAKTLGLNIEKLRNFSILRLTLVDGLVKSQEKGIEQLEEIDKKKVKQFLLELIQRL